MKLSRLLLIISVAAFGLNVRAQEDAGAAEVQDETALKAEEAEVAEAEADIKADEAEVENAPDDKVANAEETDVKHDEAIIGVQMEDVDELMMDIKDDEMDRDADVIERKLDDVIFAKEHNDKTDAERRKLELEKKKKRNIARKAKHAARTKLHAERHSKVDKWLLEMRAEHPNKVKREALKDLYSALAVEHAKIHSRFWRK